MAGSFPNPDRPPSDLAKTPGVAAASPRATVEERIAWCERQYLRGVSEAHIIRDGAKHFGLTARQLRRYMVEVRKALPDPDVKDVRKDMRRRLVAMGARALQVVIRRGEMADARSTEGGSDGIKAMGVAVQASRVEAVIHERIAKLTGADAPIEVHEVEDELDYSQLTLEEAETLDRLLVKAGAKGVE